MIDVQVREEDDVDVLGATPRCASASGSRPSLLGLPVPEAGRADAGVDEHRDVRRADEVAVAGSRQLVPAKSSG